MSDTCTNVSMGSQTKTETETETESTDQPTKRPTNTRTIFMWTSTEPEDTFVTKASQGECKAKQNIKRAKRKLSDGNDFKRNVEPTGVESWTKLLHYVQHYIIILILFDVLLYRNVNVLADPFPFRAADFQAERIAMGNQHQNQCWEVTNTKHQH